MADQALRRSVMNRNKHFKSVSVALSVLLATVAALLPSSVFNAHAERERGSVATEPAQYQYPFQNPDLAEEERVNNIISLMTIDEKVSALGTNPSVPRLGIRASGHVEGIHGLTQGGPAKWGRPLTVPTTTFPQGIGMAETWDTEIMRQAGAVEGYEARYVFQSGKYHQGGIVIRAPNADLGRDPRWGRTEECYGEDPFFNGTMAVSFIKGLQGDDPKYWQAAALLKHFLANSNENGRGSSSSDFDERLFREYYSVPFQMGIEEGGARAFMASYNAVNNVPMHVNPILENIARREWGQDGIICTDGGGMRLLVTGHKRFPDFDHAAAAVVRAGIGQFLDNYRDAVDSALKRDLLTEAEIDKALKGTFRVMIRLGLLDPPRRVPYSSIGETTTQEDPWLGDKHKALALLMTQKSVVLLKNARKLLPLDKSKTKSIAVIGPYADQVLLDWYSGTPPYTVSPLEGIRRKAGASVTVKYAANNEDGAAVRLARSSDVAVVVVGNHPTCNAGWEQCPVASDGKEAVDRKAIALEQEDLIRAVYGANPHTVVVLIASFPYAINWTQDHVPAILHMAHNSQEEGSALADALFGDYNPAGRLVQTWPRSLEQLPPMMDYDIRHGRTYMYFKGEPLYPFGYGLSYTTFAYSNLRTSSNRLDTKGAFVVSVDVKNTGTRAGEEVVQLYVRHLNSSVERPIKELKGFQRIPLQPGETKTAKIILKAAQLAYWDTKRRSFVIEDDDLQIMIGSSSADMKLAKTIKVRGASKR